MKKLLIFSIAAFFTHTVYSQVLFTYGSNSVTRDEFLRAYNKNKTAVTDKEMAMREYLDLYIKFRLKVKAAKDLRIDTLSSLANDMQNFRTQIEGSYLTDEGRVNVLVQEAYTRSQKDIHVAYRFFPIKDLKDSIAAEQHHKTVKGNWTDVGFITVFNLPYEFENIVFGLKPGEESRAYRTQAGYYIFKNLEERKAVGKINAAQILIAVPEGANAEEKMVAQRTTDSVYKALLAGADFGEVAKNISNDQMTYMSGGLLPEFGVGKYDPDFENKVFAIAKDGDIIPPFQTKFGYHIVKRISTTPVTADMNNETFMYGLKQQVMQDNRISSAKEKFVNGILKKLNYKKSPVIKDNELWILTDSFRLKGKVSGRYSAQAPLFMLDNKAVKISEWLSFLKNYPGHNGSR